MKEIPQVPSPKEFPVHSQEFWEELISGPIDFVGIHERIDDEQMKHREAPSDEEIDAMSEHYEKLTAML